MVRKVWGARREPPLCSCARWCFVTRRRGSWAIAMGITKIGSTTPTRAAAAVVWPRGCLCPSGTSNAGITKSRVIPRVLLGNTRPLFPLPGIWPAISIINPPSTGVAIGGVAIGGAPSAVALGAEPPPKKRRHGERGSDGRPRAARRFKECKKQGRTDQQQLTWCSGRQANKGETPFFLRARRRRSTGDD